MEDLLLRGYMVCTLHVTCHKYTKVPVEKTVGNRRIKVIRPK
jgi:hypothetical protein